MKKFLTIIAFIGTFVPTLHSMQIDTSSPMDAAQKYKVLISLIQNANSEAFKVAFDVFVAKDSLFPLSTDHIKALRQIVSNAKDAITEQLKAMGDKNKNWLEIAKGGLAGAYGLSNAFAAVAHFDMSTRNDDFQIKDLSSLIRTPALPAFVTTNMPLSYLFNCIDKNIYKIKLNIENGLLAIISSLIAYKTLSYAAKKLKLGFNYKEHLQTMLANLDIIDNHIAQAKI